MRLKPAFSWSPQTGSFDCIIGPPRIDVWLEDGDGFNESVTQQMQSADVLLHSVAAVELQQKTSSARATTEG